MLLAIGLMSGTSMDGVDASLISTDGENNIDIIVNHSISYSKEFRTLLKAAEYSCKKNHGNLETCKSSFKTDLTFFLTKELLLTDEEITNFIQKNFLSITEIIHKSTLYHLQAINELLSQAKSINKLDIAAIGYHGQTLFHNPKIKLSLAIGEPQFLANELQTPVIFNFRQNDLLNGGQGAPLVPIYHQAMINKTANANEYPIAIINCGGITNATIIEKNNSIIAYDIGPGACLIDRVIAKRTNNHKLMDNDGVFALQGIENFSLLQKLLKNSSNKNNFNFSNSLPKAPDVNDFHLIPEIDEVSLEDACRNLIIFTAKTIITNFKAQQITPLSVILAGGGWNNPVLVSELKQRWYKEISQNTKFLFSNELGFNSQYVESQAFGYMAIRRLKNLPISFPSTTGALSPTIGGNIFLPKNN